MGETEVEREKRSFLVLTCSLSGEVKCLRSLGSGVEGAEVGRTAWTSGGTYRVSAVGGGEPMKKVRFEMKPGWERRDEKRYKMYLDAAWNSHTNRKYSVFPLRFFFLFWNNFFLSFPLLQNIPSQDPLIKSYGTAVPYCNHTARKYSTPYTPLQHNVHVPSQPHPYCATPETINNTPYWQRKSTSTKYSTYALLYSVDLRTDIRQCNPTGWLRRSKENPRSHLPHFIPLRNHGVLWSTGVFVTVERSYRIYESG